MAGISVLAAAYVLSQFYRSFLAVLTPVLGAELGATKADLALASGAWFLAFALMQFAVGVWLDRYGPRRTASLMLGVCGAAGIFSRLEDIQLLLDMLMHDGMVDGKPFLKPQTIQTFFTPDRFHNGLGWMMDPSNSFMKGAPAGSFGHTGFTGTSICVVPELDLDIIILINRQNVGLQPNGSYFNPNPIREGIFKAVIKEYGKL